MVNRLIFCFAFAACCLWVHAQEIPRGLSRIVSLAPPNTGLPSAEALERLAARLGLTVIWDDRLRDRVWNARRAPAHEIAQEIAELTGGEWSQSGAVISFRRQGTAPPTPTGSRLYKSWEHRLTEHRQIERLLRSLTDDQLRSLRSDQQIPFTSLSASQTDFLRRLISFVPRIDGRSLYDLPQEDLRLRVRVQISARLLLEPNRMPEVTFLRFGFGRSRP